MQAREAQRWGRFGSLARFGNAPRRSIPQIGGGQSLGNQLRFDRWLNGGKIEAANRNPRLSFPNRLNALPLRFLGDRFFMLGFFVRL